MHSLKIMMSKKLIFWVILTSILIVLGITFNQQIPKRELPILGSVSDFKLYDTNGEIFSFKDLQGKVWIADFIFTTCGSVCPMMTKNMAALHRSFALVNQVEMVSISVNPENDTPEVLSQFAQRYHADTKKWHFLTGDRGEITRVSVEIFKVGSVDQPVFHSDRIILVDQGGRIRGYYQGTNPREINALFRDMNLILNERAS